MSQSLTLAQKRQAIENGLKPYFDASLLANVVQYWEQNYGDQPSFVLNRFISEICDTDELRLSRKEILKQLLSSLSDVEKNHQLIVKEKAPISRNTDHSAQVSDDLWDAFSMFVSEVARYIQPQDLDDFDDELKKKLSGLKIDVLSKAQFNAVSFLENIPITFYAKFLTETYALLCEFYGPVKSDQIYAVIKNKLKNDYPKLDLNTLL